jgi:hypothetical protein
MATSVDSHKGEVSTRLEVTDFVTLATEEKILGLCRFVVLVAGPLKSLSPGLVAEPIADVVSITSVDQDGDLLENTRDDAVEGLHPITLHEEIAVDVEVARVVGRDLGANGLHDLRLVKVRRDPVNFVIAKGVAATGTADVIYVLAGALVGTDHSIVTVNGGGDTAPDGLRGVAILDETSALGISVLHRLARALVQDSGPTSLSASHRLVIFVLGQAIGETVSDKDGLEVDVTLLVGENLRSKHGNVVTSI